MSSLSLISEPLSYAADEEEKPTLEEIAKTEAAKLFIAKQYRQSLAEFEKLEDQHPKNIIIKRYIASLHDSLREWDQAVAKLKEALAINREDLIARQLLGDVYVKRAELDLASKEFQFILDKDPEGALGKYAKRRLEEISRLKAMPKTEKGKQMAVEDFMKSPASQAFAQGKYGEAFQGFSELMIEYPEDILIRRFRGITLLRLKRTDEAIAAFQEALTLAPDNVAVHFYLGQAYLDAKKPEESRKEFQWVIANDQTSYRARAQRAIFQTLGKGAAPSQKPLSVSIITGYDFDTNATYKSNNEEFTASGDQNSSRYPLTVTGSYRLYQNKKWSYTADALYTHTLYQDFPNLQTYTYGAGISALYTFSILKKPSFLNLREGATQTFLKNKYFLWSNTVSASLITVPHRRLRSSLTYRFAVSEYDSSGSDPDRTSRDGFQHTISLSNNWYFNNERTLYLLTAYDYERHETSGDNFIKNVHSPKIGIHFPLKWQIEGDVSYKLKDSKHFQFVTSSDLPKRRDDVHTLTSTFTRPLTKALTLTGTHTYEDSRAKHNQYEYTKNVFSVSVTYKY